jgi:hypothetical protein
VLHYECVLVKQLVSKLLFTKAFIMRAATDASRQVSGFARISHNLFIGLCMRRQKENSRKTIPNGSLLKTECQSSGERYEIKVEEGPLFHLRPMVVIDTDTGVIQRLFFISS